MVDIVWSWFFQASRLPGSESQSIILGVAGLDNNSATVKKQILDLLSALCQYSPEGYGRALEALQYYKVRDLGYFNAPDELNYNP